MQTELKYFTPAEASSTLPLVKRIVADILNDASIIRMISESFNDDIEKHPEVIRLSDNIKGYLEELEEIGCFFKDWNFQIGLVDFPSRINGEEVLLCWRSDEDNIKYYHGFNEGYANRKLIPEEYLQIQKEDSIKH